MLFNLTGHRFSKRGASWPLRGTLQGLL